MRQLKEIAKKILDKKYSGDPKKMSTALGLDLMYVRRAVGLAALDGTTQQKTFEFTVKLLPLCKELGIDPAQDLKGEETLQQEVSHVAPLIQKLRPDEVSKDPAARPARKAPQRSKKHLPARRNDGNQRRKQ